MRHAAELARQGHGQLVAAIADPGVGKSRLFYEFKSMTRSGWMILDTFSVSHGRASAYLPVIELLHNYFDISAEEDERKRREKVAGKIIMLDRAFEETIPYLFNLLGIVEDDDPLDQMNSEIKKRRTMEAIKRILVRESLNQPVMLIFEDLHWLDSESQGLLSLLADSIPNTKILLLVNYRPEYRHEWGNKGYYTQLRLDPLAAENAAEMLNALVGEHQSLSALRHLIVEKTDGNPFFIEEIVQHLFEERSLVRNGEVKLTRPLAGIRIPATVQAMLAARIDRLAPEEKELLQTAAVIGTDFGLGLVGAVWDQAQRPGTTVEEMLSSLQLAKFIYEQPTPHDVEYTFKHALTHEVAYNSILLERRKRIHERTALALERLHVHDRGDFVAELAHHYGRSGNVEKAVEYLFLAGEQSVARSALTEAAGYTRKALELVPHLPAGIERDRTELKLLLALAATQVATAGTSSSERFRSLELARELCDRIETAGEIFPVLWQLCQSYMQAGRYTQAAAIADRSIRLAEQDGDRVHIMLARYNLGEFDFRTGNFFSSRQHIQRAVELFQNERDARLARLYGIDIGVSVFGFSAWNNCVAGFLDRGLEDAKATINYARTQNLPYSLGLALVFSYAVHYWRREPVLAMQNAAEAIALSAEHAFPEIDAMVRATHGWSKTATGRVEEGVAEGIEAIRMMQSLGIPYPTYTVATLADTYLIAGRYHDALRTADEGLKMVAESGEHGSEASLLSSRGEALLWLDRIDEAERSLSAAIDLARTQGSRLDELRATKSLARVLARHGRRDEARERLAAIYHWFTEGFDTAVVKEARALLNELASEQYRH